MHPTAVTEFIHAAGIPFFRSTDVSIKSPLKSSRLSCIPSALNKRITQITVETAWEIIVATATLPTPSFNIKINRTSSRIFRTDETIIARNGV